MGLSIVKSTSTQKFNTKKKKKKLALAGSKIKIIKDKF